MYRCTVAKKKNFEGSEAFDIEFKGHRRPLSGRVILEYSMEDKTREVFIAAHPFWFFNQRKVLSRSNALLEYLSHEHTFACFRFNPEASPLACDGLRFLVSSPTVLDFHIEAAFIMA